MPLGHRNFETLNIFQHIIFERLVSRLKRDVLNGGTLFFEDF